MDDIMKKDLGVHEEDLKYIFDKLYKMEKLTCCEYNKALGRIKTYLAGGKG